MSLLKKLTEKLEAISREEDQEFEKLANELDKKNASVKKSHRVKKTEKKGSESEWEDLDEVDVPSKEKVRTVIKNRTTSDALFPNDVSRALEASSKKRTQFMQKTIDDVKNEKVDDCDSMHLKSHSISPLFKELHNSEGFVEAKIVELSKKIRELNAQLISTQNKLRIAESHISSQETVQMETVSTTEVSEGDITKYESEIKELSKKYQACNAKLCEARNIIQQQKHEIKILNKALASEVGDNYSIHNVSSDGWRGRAQQISSLQQKVVELSEKLSLTSIPSIEKTVSAVQSFEKSQDKERIAAMSKEVEELKSQLGDAKNKGDQARARLNVLTGDIAVLKSKYEILRAKNEEDIKLINTLTTKLTKVSQRNHERELNLVKRYDDQLASLNTELKQERVKTDQYQKIVSERDARIKKLEEKIQECYKSSQQPYLMKNGIDFNRPPTSGFCSDKSATQHPSDKSSNNTISMMSSNSNYSQSLEVERLRLMELITVLNRRLDEERKNLDKVQDNLRIEKQKTAKLESKVSKLEMEKVGKNYRRPTGRQESLSKFELESTRDQCALLKEKCLALESRLERLRLEKEEDSRLYVRMVEEARSALRDHVRKSSTCSASS